jgi:hypothetical protein
MKRSLSVLVTLVTLPSLVGCYGVMRTPVPASQPEREALDLRGVVVDQPSTDESEVLEFTELHEATWTPSSLSFVADVDRGQGQSDTVTRLVPITQLEAVMVRRFDAGKTSAIIGGLIVGAIAAVALIITGDADSYQQGG